MGVWIALGTNNNIQSEDCAQATNHSLDEWSV